MRKINIIYLTFIFILISNLSKAQSSFYETDSLKEIRIYFYEPNWQSTLDSLYIIGNDERTFAYLVIDGEQLTYVIRCLAFLDQISENNGDFLTRETLIRTVVSICIANVNH